MLFVVLHLTGILFLKILVRGAIFLKILVNFFENFIPKWNMLIILHSEVIKFKYNNTYNRQFGVQGVATKEAFVLLFSHSVQIDLVEGVAKFASYLYI